MPSDTEKNFRAKKELIDNLPQLYFPNDDPEHEPFTDDEYKRVLKALEHSGVENAHHRYEARGALWIYETLNMMAYSDSYPDGDEPPDLQFVPCKLATFITSCNYGECTPDTILQRREPGGWNDVLIDGRPAAQPIDYDGLQPGSYRLVEPNE